MTANDNKPDYIVSPISDELNRFYNVMVVLCKQVAEFDRMTSKQQLEFKKAMTEDLKNFLNKYSFIKLQTPDEYKANKKCKD